MRFGRNVCPEISQLCPFAVDNLLVLVYECISIPVSGATQLTSGISWRSETGQEAIALAVGIPPDRDKPLEVASDSPSRMPLGHKHRPTASEPNVYRSAAARTIRDRFTVLHDFNSVPIPTERFGKASYFRNNGGFGRLT